MYLFVKPTLKVLFFCTFFLITITNNANLGFPDLSLFNHSYTAAARTGLYFQTRYIKHEYYKVWLFWALGKNKM
jgi:hypothetical protein